MSPSVRAHQARLLADTRGAEPRARLAQAVSRADFLLRLSRTLGSIQNPQRALEAVVDRLLDEMVDLAHVVVRTGPWQLSCGGVHGTAPHSRVDRWTDSVPPAVQQALTRAVSDQVSLSRERDLRHAALAAYLSPEQLVEEAVELPIDRLLLLPLTSRGRTFGLLVLGRTLGFGDVAPFLEDLASRIATGLDAALILAESRHVTSVLRDSLAPAALPEIDHLDIATYTRVAHQSEALGGDLLDVHGAADDLVLVCGDVAGKGVEAAVHAKRIRNAVRTLSQVDRDPGWILGLVNRVLVAEATPFSEALSTAVCARLRPGDAGLRVDLASAGHPPALVLRADGTVEAADAEGVSLALVDDATYTSSTLTLGSRDTLLLYTDGVTEARGADAFFGDDSLRRILEPLCGHRPQAVVNAVAVAVSDHLGDRTSDDIALLAVQYLPEDL